MSNAPVADGHDRPRCGAKKRNGDPCGLPAGHGTNHVGIGRCRRHGGNTPTQVKAARNEAARLAVQSYGLPRDVDPHTALLEELHWTAGHVAWLREIVAGLDEAEMTGPVGGGRDSYPKHEPSVWIRLYQEERAHLTRVARTCADVGVEERQVRVAEQIGGTFARAIEAIVRGLGLDPGDPGVREVVRRELTVIAGGAG